VMARFGYWTLLMTAALAALGLDRLASARPGRSGARAVAAGCAVLIVFEGWSIKATTEVRAWPVDHWIAAQPPQEVIVELPLSEALRPIQDYYVTVQQHPRVFGPIGDSFQSPILLDRVRALFDFPSSASLSALRSYGATLVVIDTRRVTDAARMCRELERTAGVRHAADLDGAVVFRLE